MGVFTTMYWILQVVVFAFDKIVDTLKKHGVLDYLNISLRMAEMSINILLD